MPAAIDHPVLGKLTWKADLSCWETRVELRSGCPIDLRIGTQRFASATDNMEALFDGGVAMLAWARRAEQECRERIADKMLDLYNDNWAPDESDVPMGREEFIAQLAPSSLVRNKDGSGHFYWKDGGLFAGHRIELRLAADFAISEIGLAG